MLSMLSKYIFLFTSSIHLLTYGYPSCYNAFNTTGYAIPPLFTPPKHFPQNINSDFEWAQQSLAD
jgi:hypothetical protein